MMKKIFLTFMLVAFGILTAFAQVGIGTTTPDVNAVLDISSTTQGLLLPRMTSSQRDAINSTGTPPGPAKGLTIFNTTADCIQTNTGTPAVPNWKCFKAPIALDCANAVFNKSIYQKNVPYTGTLTIPYTGGDGSSYVAYNVTSTGNTDFTATAPAGNLAIGAGSLVLNVSGTSSSGAIANFAITVNGVTCNLIFTTCGGFIAPGVFKEFLCYNLGADTSLDPQTPVVGLQGAYIQWGRRGPNTTGDSRVDWQTAGNTANFAAAPTSSNNNAGAISGWSTVGAATNAWRTAGGAKTLDDPCPSGYRVPTPAEWTGINNNNALGFTGLFVEGQTQYGSARHFGSKQLTLPAAGYRRYLSSGSQNDRGVAGYYWSSTEDGALSWSLTFYQAVNLSIKYDRTNGFSLRCIAE